MVRVGKPLSPPKAAQIACNSLKSDQLLTMLRGYIDPARRDSKMVAEIFKELEGRLINIIRKG